MNLVLPLLILASLGATAAPPNASPPANAQAELTKLYEEEILAHDLYVALGEIYPEIRPFQNIPHSEIQHRDALAAVMKELQVPMPEPPKGQRFASDGLDKMFDDLLAAGRKSPQAACEIGVGFEELDISELRAAQKRIPAAKDTLVQLEWASGNHLRAFHRNLTARGSSYKATHLKRKDLKSILNGKGPEGAAGCGQGCGKTSEGTCKTCGKPTGQASDQRTGPPPGRGPGNGPGNGRGPGKGQGRGNGSGRNR